MWKSVDEGKTIGTTGSENGIIILDEELEGGSRITLEKDGHAPFGITCNACTKIIHTAFAETEDEAREKVEGMKKDIEDFAKRDNELNLAEWCHGFIKKW